MPNQEFWVTAITNVKQTYPNFKFMAEAYNGWEQTLIGFGFDFVYDKDGLLNTLWTQNVTAAAQYIQSKAAILPTGSHFIENHDEKRAAATFRSNQVANAAGLISFTLPGMRFHFMGQWLGRKNQLEIHLRRSYQNDTDTNSTTVSLYNTLLPRLNDDVWHNGCWALATVSGTNNCGNILAWTWDSANQSVLVVINFSNSTASGQVKLNVSSNQVIFQDILTGQNYTRNGTEVKYEGLFVTVQPYNSQIFYYSK